MSIKRAIALILCCAAIALCAVNAYSVPAALQYVLSAPKAVMLADEPQPDAPAEDGEGGADGAAQAEKSELKTLFKSLDKLAGEWTGIISAYGAATLHTAVAMEGARTQTAALTGVYGALGALPQKIMRSGRYFYTEETASAARVLVLDEQLAIALFRVGDPIGRTVIVNQQKYTVIGVARHTRAPGDKAAYGAYAPAIALENDGIQTETLTVWAKPVPGAGAAARFESDMARWKAGGNFYSLSKERTRALLPARILLCVAGALLVLEGFRLLLWLAKRFAGDCRERLKHVFAVQLTGRMAAYAGACVLFLALLLAAFYYVAQFALAPVYVFPEWIPAVLVEVSDIIETFWNNRAAGGGLIEYRTPEVLTLRFYQGALTILCALTGAVAVQWQGITRGWRTRGKGRFFLSEKERNKESA